MVLTSSATKTCYVCGAVAVGFRWIYGGYYFACYEHQEREPDEGIHPDLKQEALDRLHGRSKL